MKTNTVKKPRKRGMNVALLRRIKREILKEPRRFMMGGWLYTHSSNSPCGTTACIGGWAVILSKAGRKRITVQTLPEIAQRIYGQDLIEEEAMRALRLSYGKAWHLFNSDLWPEPFKSIASRTAEGTREFAQNAAKRIEHFIETKGEV